LTTCPAGNAGSNQIRRYRMAEETITVLVPTSAPRVKEVSLAPRVNDLNGKVIGFLWNRKPNADILLRRIQEQLSAKFQLAGTSWQQKPGAVVPADAAIVDELVGTSDVVINAMGD